MFLPQKNIVKKENSFMTKTTRMRRFLSVLLVIVMACTLVLPAMAAQDDGEKYGKSLKIAVLSDIHYMSPTMIKDTEDFTTALNSDRKMLAESDAINLELLDAVRKDKPDVLLVSGDLTKDGELECHQVIAERLQQLEKDVPGLKVYVINGNHDVRNKNALNFNTADGVAVPATRTEPADFAAAYDFVYSDDSIAARYTPPEGKESGQLSYVAQIADGITLVALDTCCYSADNNSKGEVEHETRGEMSPELEAWAIEQVSAAKARGDLVIGLAHHGFVPHFSMEPDILSMYLVENYERIAAELADAGMEMIFTGHMHAQDIAKLTTENGNTMYDIETGSGLTYPSPVRFVELRELGGSMIVNVTTKNHVGPITFTDPATGERRTIDDLSEYGRTLGFSEDMLATVAGSFLGNFLNKFVIVDNALSSWVNARIVANIQSIVRDLVNIPVTEDKTLLDAVNYIYQSHLGGEDDGNYPDWVQTGLDKIESGEILNEILRIVKVHAFGDAAASVKFDNIFTNAVKAKVNDLILDIADSMGRDTNFPTDNDAVIILGDSVSLTSVPVSCGNASLNAPAVMTQDSLVVFPTEIMLRELGAAGKTVVIDGSASKAPALEVWGCGMTALSAAAKVEFKTAGGSAAFNTADIVKGGDFTVGIGTPELNEAQKRALGSQLDSARAFVVNAAVGGEAVKAGCTASIPYTVPSSESSNTLAAISIDDNGAIACAGGGYSKGCFTCGTKTGLATALVRFPFLDIPDDYWCYGDIAYAYNNNLFKGTAEDTFSPTVTMTRGMLVTVLWRMEDQPKAEAASFADTQGIWCSAAIDWAAANGIVNGFNEKTFAPNAPITREQMAMILYRYAAYKNVDVSASADITGFVDYDRVSLVARDAMAWANAEGIINGGHNNDLMPRDGATRAQVAAILHRYIESCIY